MEKHAGYKALIASTISLFALPSLRLTYFKTLHILNKDGNVYHYATIDFLNFSRRLPKIKGKSFNQYIMAIFLNSKTTQTLHSVKEVLKADSCAVIAVFV